MAISFQDYTATADQVANGFSFSFPYLSDNAGNALLEVYVQGGLLSSSSYTITTSPQKIVIASGQVSVGNSVKIARASSTVDPLVDFQNGSVLTESELDRGYLHGFYLFQETAEGSGGELLFKKDGVSYDAEGNKIINLGTPGASTDAANKGYVDQTIDDSIALGGSPAIVSLGGYNVTDITGSLTQSLANWTAPTATNSSEARSLTDRFADVVNVLDYGASTTNTPLQNQTAFTNALIAAHGKALEIPPGNYLIESTLDISAGAGNKPKLIFGGGGLSYNGTGACIVLNGSVSSFQRISIENISIGVAEGNSETDLIGLWLNGGSGSNETSRVNLSNVLISGFDTRDSIALKLNRTWLNTFVGCEFFENYIGINLNGTANNNSFYGCVINGQKSIGGLGGHGVLIDDLAVSNLFSGCDIENNKGSGIKIEKPNSPTSVICNGLTVDTCYFEANLEYDVHLNGNSIVSTHLTNNFHEQPENALGTIYGEAHSDLVVSGFFQSSDQNEATPGFVTTASGTNITTNNIHINGWNNGANFYSINSASKRATIDNGVISSNVKVSAKELGAGPSNDDLAAALEISTGRVANQTNCNVKIVTKSQEISHTQGSATNTDFKIVTSTDPGWASCYIMYTFNSKQGQANANYYSANWSLGGHSTSGTAWTTTYSALLDEHFSTGGGHTASAVNDVDSDLCFRHTISGANTILTTEGVGTMTAIFLYSTV